MVFPITAIYKYRLYADTIYKFGIKINGKYSISKNTLAPYIRFLKLNLTFITAEAILTVTRLPV